MTPSDTTSIKIARNEFGEFAVDTAHDMKIYLHINENKQHKFGFHMLMKYFVNPNSVVVDAGAHIGTFAIPFSRRSKKVYAFEPFKKTFDLLEQNISRNGVTNVEAIHAALGSSVGRAHSISTEEDAASGQMFAAGAEGDIPVTSIDQKVNHANLIKIDVEGMESEVLKGARNVISRSHPAMYIEVYPKALRIHGVSHRSIEKILTETRYRIYFPFQWRGETILGNVSSLGLLKGVLMPKYFFNKNNNMNFDILALHEDREVPTGLRVVSFFTTICSLVVLNVKGKVERVTRRGKK